ncbi:MAG TPA: glutamyl-tRNA reductase [Chloroflexota bacterium]|nr:glutamyl-tRNA reductase [Chloroflexota bacterium]
MLRVVGLSFRSAPVELREKVLIGETELGPALQKLGHGVILSTCNRTEIYQVADGDGTYPDAARFLEQRFDGAADLIQPHLYEIEQGRAVRHLYAVAAGLDSMVLGEPQILGQVRAAVEAAEAAGTAAPVLSHVFRQAIRAGRRARGETFVGRHAVSISYAAVELARTVFGRLDGCRALVIGAGEMGELTVRTLVDHGVGVVAVANRTLAHADALATRFGGTAVLLEQLVPALVDSDIVISSTDAPGYVISSPDVERAVARRGGRPLFLVDIAVPRDVDPLVRALPNVFLYDIDDLKALCDLNREGRRAEVQQVRQIIDDEAQRFERWWRARQVVPTIVAVRQQAERARQAELAEALGKLSHLSDADRATVDDLTRALVAKLLHRPTVRLRELADAADDAAIRVVRSLYGL